MISHGELPTAGRALRRVGLRQATHDVLHISANASRLLLALAQHLLNFLLHLRMALREIILPPCWLFVALGEDVFLFVLCVLAIIFCVVEKRCDGLALVGGVVGGRGVVLKSQALGVLGISAGIIVLLRILIKTTLV